MSRSKTRRKRKNQYMTRLDFFKKWYEEGALLMNYVPLSEIELNRFKREFLDDLTSVVRTESNLLSGGLDP